MQQGLVAAAVAGIVAVGGGVGYAIGSGEVVDIGSGGSVHPPRAAATYHACPDAGPLGQLHRGDRVLLTGVDETGEWFELRSPIDLLDRVWVRASVVTPDAGAVTDLPERTCGVTDEELTLAELPADEPDDDEEGTEDEAEGEEADETTTTAVEPGTPTTTPTAAQPPATTPPGQSSPTPPPADRTGPRIVAFTRGAPGLRVVGGEFCTEHWRPTSTEVSVQVADPSGVASVVLAWAVPNVDGHIEVTMVRDGGSTYRATLGPFPGGFPGSDEEIDLEWTVTAIDGLGNRRTVTAPASAAVTLVGC